MTAVNRGIQKNVHSHPANTVLISEGDMAQKRMGMIKREGLLIYGHHAVVFYIFLRKLVSGKLENVYISNRNVKKSSADENLGNLLVCNIENCEVGSSPDPITYSVPWT